jgi:hypothetical protein
MRKRYGDGDALDDTSAGIGGSGGSGVAAVSSVLPLALLVEPPACPRRPPPPPRRGLPAAGGSLAATCRAGGCVMYWKLSLTTGLPVSNDGWINTLLTTGSLACAKALGPINIIPAPTAALMIIMCLTGAALWAVGRAFNLHLLHYLQVATPGRRQSHYHGLR